MAINHEGQIAFDAWLTGGDVVDGVDDEGLWSNVSGSLELVARSGSPAADAPAGVNYGLFSESSFPLLNDSGQLAFHAGLAGSGVDSSNNEGIWLGEPSDLMLVARRGEQAPDTPSGVNFAHLHYPSLNSAGQIAFRADLTGDGVDSTNGRGIWATDHEGALQLIARTGEQLEVAADDLRTLSNLDFIPVSGNSDNRRSAFNNLGQLAFWASFTDGSEGVFVSNLVASLPMLLGDYNNNGTVEQADLDLVLLNWGTELINPTAAGWLNDLPIGPVNQQELDRVLLNWGIAAPFGAASVPEPPSVAMLLVGCAIVLLAASVKRSAKCSRCEDRCGNADR
jgi:hypothetical protein